MPPLHSDRSVDHSRLPALRWSRWNLLLLLPLLVIFTPVYNRIEPTMFGIPFFYWAQLATILFGVLCTFAVYLLTRNVDTEDTPPVVLLDVNQEDAGTWQ